MELTNYVNKRRDISKPLYTGANDIMAPYKINTGHTSSSSTAFSSDRDKQVKNRYPLLIGILLFDMV